MGQMQLMLEEAQEQALKRQAEALGISKEEFVRQALERALELAVGTRVAPAHERRQALEDLLEHTKLLAQQAKFPADYRFNREELYEERLKKWDKEE